MILLAVMRISVETASLGLLAYGLGAVFCGKHGGLMDAVAEFERSILRERQS